MSAFTSALHDISEKCIPKSSTRSKRRSPWFNDECKTAINKHQSALRKFNKNPSRENHMHSKLAHAKARRTIKDAKRTSWRQYVNKLNSRTRIKKVWDMIRKVSALGAFRTSPVESLYAESNKPSLYIRREKLSLQYTTKLAANPKNPAHNCIFNPKYERFYDNTPSAIRLLGLRIQPLLEQANISIKNVQPFSLPSKEPWTQNPPKVILDLHKNKKSEVYSHIFKTEFLEIKSAYKHYMFIYTDGSKQDEKVACAVISPNFTDSIRLPDNSSIFTAEAKAIDNALYHIRDQTEKQFIIYSDSLSVLRSLKNLDYRNPLIQQILRKYNYLSSFKEIVFCWLPSHTNIRGNELADLEAKSALSLSITNLKIPHTDFKSNIHQYVMNKCQSVW